MSPSLSLSEALREVVQAIDRRLGKEATHAEAVRLMTAAYILTGLRVPREDLASIYRGIGLMQESTAFDEVLEEGLVRGRAEGREEGELQGRIQLLLRQGRKRFGQADPPTEAALMGIRDLERLERLGEAILSAVSWEEWLATP